MKIDRLVILLGICIFAMGVWSMVRTGTPAPLMMGGGVAAVTVWIGWMMGMHFESARGMAIGWLILVVGALVLAAIGGIFERSAISIVSVIIFASLALFAVGTLILVIRASSRRWSGPNRPSRRF